MARLGRAATQVNSLGHHLEVRASMDQYLLTQADLQPANYGRGLVPRDYTQCPVGYLYCAKPFDLPLMTDDEIEACIRRKDADNSWLDNIRDRGAFGSRIPSRNQGSRGYCWKHSGTSAALLVRARDNQPYVDLSAYAGACIIKNYRDEGGWGSEGIEFQASRGDPSSDFWPQQSTDRACDNPATWENAKLHRVAEWMDLEPRNARQWATCLCNNIPVVADRNWWSHSTCDCRLIAWNGGRNPRVRTWNSWGDSWKQAGMGDLEGSQAIPDGMIAPRTITAATV